LPNKQKPYAYTWEQKWYCTRKKREREKKKQRSERRKQRKNRSPS